MKTIVPSNNHIRKVMITTTILVVITVGALLTASFVRNSNALTAADWQAGRIIDDSVFYNGNDMSVQEIQAFLNQKNPNCDTNGTQRYNSSMTNAQYAASRGWAGPPYVCLKDYYQVPRNDQNVNNLTTNVVPAGAISAAQIIKNASATYNVSSRAILVLLEKESLNLIKDNFPVPNQFRNPMGFGCPDTAPCDPQYEGFYNQVSNAARQFKIYKENANSYRHKAYQNNSILFQANNPGCGSSTVYVESQASAGLYNYTPYQPNQAALNNMYGTGDVCSAYGNRNFWRIFNDWFGNTRGPELSVNFQSFQLYSDAGLKNKVPVYGDTYVVQPGQDLYLQVRALNDGRLTWNSYTKIGTTAPYERDSAFYDSSWPAPHRLANLTQGQEVAPGQVATAKVKLKAPASAFLYEEQFGVIQEGMTWLNKTFPLKIQVSAPKQYTDTPAGYSLLSGTEMTTGQSLMSSDGYSYLHLDQNGSLELYVNFNKVWSTPSAGKNAHFAMQQDGNLVLYTSTGTAVWSSATSGNGISNAYLQGDGNLVVYKSNGQSTWSSGTSIGIGHERFPTSELPNNGVIYRNQAIESYDRSLALHFQGDGNLVLYDTRTWKALWSSATDRTTADHAAMQGDGNLVVYTPEGKALWSSGTSGKNASRLVLQNDGNLVIYNAQSYTWSSATSR